MLKNCIRSILSANEDKKLLNILVIGATHERYEQQLCLTGHKFYSFKDGGKEWNTHYGPIPPNYFVLDAIPTYLRPDLVLTHVSGDRLELAHKIAHHYGIKVIRHTHTLPQSPQELRAFHDQRADLNTFISQYSCNAWGEKYGFVINHGLDTKFWCEKYDKEKNTQILSVVNFWADRDWACGWTLYNKIKSIYSERIYEVLGDNPGLSIPARSLKFLRDEYSSCGIFLNTSQFSPIPMSLLEAMACGAPCVSSNTCMIPEIIQHGYNGWLANTPEEFVSCIKSLQDREFAQELGNNARQTILNLFNIEQFVENWNLAFRKVLIK